MSADQILTVNLNRFDDVTAQAASMGAQVVVFSEGGIGYSFGFANATTARDTVFTFAEQVPDVNNGLPYIIPCDMPNVGKQLHRLSCIARKSKVILAVNMASYQPCSPSTDPLCPADLRYQFNTEVVFNEEGQLMSTYHKTHLFGEDEAFNQPAVCNPRYFDSSFGVRFGLMICFDIQVTNRFQAQFVAQMSYSSYI